MCVDRCFFSFFFFNFGVEHRFQHLISSVTTSINYKTFHFVENSRKIEENEMEMCALSSA